MMRTLLQPSTEIFSSINEALKPLETFRKQQEEIAESMKVLVSPVTAYAKELEKTLEPIRSFQSDWISSVFLLSNEDNKDDRFIERKFKCG